MPRIRSRRRSTGHSAENFEPSNNVPSACKTLLQLFLLSLLFVAIIAETRRHMMFLTLLLRCLTGVAIRCVIREANDALRLLLVLAIIGFLHLLRCAPSHLYTKIMTNATPVWDHPFRRNFGRLVHGCIWRSEMCLNVIRTKEANEKWIEFSSKLWEARSRLYRRRFLQVNTRWKALDEIYKMYILLHRSDL